MRRLRWSLWLLVAVALSVFALFGLQLSRPRNDFVESAMIGKPMPAFDLPAMVDSRPGLASTDLADGTPRLLNVFASWCVPCAAEAPQLAALEREGVPIVAVAIRDKPDSVARFLGNYGNPFTRIGRDDISEVQLSLGSSGVPETFVIDGAGTITYQHIGPIMDRDIPVLLEELRKAGA
ncbi:DsbE family thiol:disulfide interchange protein [Aurantiacibacter spongiae]|uniref:DsbE family thiol:disulfide interchange protein n=1 Tax=Aurantiacibacter spongiae TaxID=2488860 RepID=A0A3N5CUT0_9SPHN|nr:DsbE family thiol:disulfide interchange protein [Aurantiacibacter spongiae]RPF72487.1 DsbE family thiol:disulfide interchange protein [Aurantiacibacter spongiae]